MDILPIALTLQHTRCLVVGGGSVAMRKASMLVRAGAVVDVVSINIIPQLQTLIAQCTGNYRQESYNVDMDLSTYRLVIAATNNKEINNQIFLAGSRAHVLVNSVDDPANSHFYFPAIIDRSPIIVSISSGGTSPVLTRLLRTQIEALLPAAYGELAQLAGAWRERVKQVITAIPSRIMFWEKIFQGNVASAVFNQDIAAANSLLSAQLAQWQNDAGEVFLVGAGPGDPDLLTLKALQLMQRADVVVYDRLVSLPILDMCRRDAEKIYVGKAKSNHTLPQEDINTLLVRLAREGKRVCRLKGGDPFIFGRGGEEIAELAAQGIRFQVVPGITAASGCAAYAGIPLTHRDYAQSVRFITGHLQAGSAQLPWQDLLAPQQTLVLYMGLTGLATIATTLIAHGKHKNTPVALISKGTQPEQQVIVGTLATIEMLLAQNHIVAPTLTIIGDVVNLRNQLTWR